MKNQSEQMKADNKLVNEPDVTTNCVLNDLLLTESQTAQVKGGPSAGDDVLIGGRTSYEQQSASSRPVGGVNVCLGDGSVKFIR